MTTPSTPLQTRRSNAAIAACICALISFLALDLWTKQWASETLSVERMGSKPPVCKPDDAGYISMQRLRKEAFVLIPDYLEFRYAENCGAAFGLLRAASESIRNLIFRIAAIVASAVLLWHFIQGKGQAAFAFSVPLIVSGALGNLIDRIRYGYVVDFIRFHLHEKWEWPTFNIADSVITVGVILLVLDGMREHRNPVPAASSAK